MIAVAEQVKMYELKRCASIAKMSNEKVKRRTSKDDQNNQPPSSPTKAITNSPLRHKTPVEETSSQAQSERESPCEEPMVKLNPDLVKLFTSQIESRLSPDVKAGEEKEKSRRNETEKDQDSSAASYLTSRRRTHGPSPPLNALRKGQGRGAGRGGSSRGKFYSTM